LPYFYYSFVRLLYLFPPSYRISFIHSAICLTTGPQPLPKQVLYRGRSSASFFIFHYPVISLRSYNSCLRLLSRPSLTSILPRVFPSITCFRRQFLRKTWPIQLLFCLFTSVKHNCYVIITWKSGCQSPMTTCFGRFSTILRSIRAIICIFLPCNGQSI
jgi:hypothetical protein